MQERICNIVYQTECKEYEKILTIVTSYTQPYVFFWAARLYFTTEELKSVIKTSSICRCMPDSINKIFYFGAKRKC